MADVELRGRDPLQQGLVLTVKCLRLFWREGSAIHLLALRRPRQLSELNRSSALNSWCVINRKLFKDQTGTISSLLLRAARSARGLYLATSFSVWIATDL